MNPRILRNSQFYRWGNVRRVVKVPAYRPPFGQPAADAHIFGQHLIRHSERDMEHVAQADATELPFQQDNL